MTLIYDSRVHAARDRNWGSTFGDRLTRRPWRNIWLLLHVHTPKCRTFDFLLIKRNGNGDFRYDGNLRSAEGIVHSDALERLYRLYSRMFHGKLEQPKRYFYHSIHAYECLHGIYISALSVRFYANLTRVKESIGCQSFFLTHNQVRVWYALNKTEWKLSLHRTPCYFRVTRSYKLLNAKEVYLGIVKCS